eukprot:scaffold1726_cov260-Pinguiococcus_pyrenoidosus.AAC.7
MLSILVCPAAFRSHLPFSSAAAGEVGAATVRIKLLNYFVLVLYQNWIPLSPEDGRPRHPTRMSTASQQQSYCASQGGECW